MHPTQVLDGHDSLADTCGIIFCGTPHQGSDFADWVAILRRLLSPPFEHAFSSNTKITDALRRDSGYLGQLQERFADQLTARRKAGSPVEVYCFYEELNKDTVLVNKVYGPSVASLRSLM